MKRRQFGKVLATGTIGSAVSLNKTATAQPKKALMYATNQQRFRVNDKDLQFLQRCGVHYKTAYPTYIPGKGWDLNEILQWKDKCLEYDITLEGLILPIESKEFTEGHAVPNFMRGNYDKGDRELDMICDMIRIAAKADMRVLLFCLKEMENQRTGSTPGRGGVHYSTWDLEKAKNTPRYDKPVTAEQNWERVTYFLERAIPVATEYKVQMANHPEDCWLPPGFRGVDRILGGAEGFKKYIEICPSPYNGLLLCLGCFAEACDDPPTEVYDQVKYFAERKKIFHIHFRNIIGRKNKFMEVFPDEGVVDMYRVAKVLYDAGYPYGLAPDHYPTNSKEDPGSYQSGAYHYGYINAIIQAVNHG